MFQYSKHCWWWPRSSTWKMAQQEAVVGWKLHSAEWSGQNHSSSASGMLSTTRKSCIITCFYFKELKYLEIGKRSRLIITFLFLIPLNTNTEQLQCISLALRFSCKHKRAKFCLWFCCFVIKSVLCTLKMAVGSKGNELYKIWRRTWPTGCLF